MKTIKPKNPQLRGLVGILAERLHRAYYRTCLVYGHILSHINIPVQEPARDAVSCWGLRCLHHKNDSLTAIRTLVSRRYLCHLITCADIVTPVQGNRYLGSSGLYGRERSLATVPHVVRNPYQLTRRSVMGLFSILRGLVDVMLTNPCGRLEGLTKKKKGGACLNKRSREGLQ